MLDIGISSFFYILLFLLIFIVTEYFTSSIFSAWLTYATYLNAGVVYKNYCPHAKKGVKKAGKEDSEDKTE